jgi:hypothetical protein
MIKTYLSLAAATAAIALGGTADAQGTPEAATAQEVAAEPGCELHVFPTLEGQAMTTGLLSGFGVIGAVADAAKNKNRNVNEAEYLKEALGPGFQVESMKTIDLAAALKLPPSKITYETPIGDRKITTKAKNRLSTSTAGCYAELIVTQNFYTKKAIYGRSLNNRFIFKDFRGGKTEANLVKGRGGNGLSQFPPKTEEDKPAAEEDLRGAFVKNFMEFSKGMRAGR